MMVQLRRGILIAFDGIDGAGKTTQAKMLQRSLASAGLQVTIEKEPTDGPWGEKIRSHLRRGQRLSPSEELEAFQEDRRAHVAEVIGPALSRGEVIILDRYFLSSAAYQGSRGMDPLKILAENEQFAAIPDVAFILVVTVEEAIRRIKARGNGSNLFERKTELEAVSAAFELLQRPYIRRLDGTPNADYIAGQILSIVRDGPIFEASCMKSNREECEPVYCGFRHSETCAFVELSRSGLHRAL